MMELEQQDACSLFWDVLVMRIPDGSLEHGVYHKPTNTDCYLKDKLLSLSTKKSSTINSSA